MRRLSAADRKVIDGLACALIWHDNPSERATAEALAATFPDIPAETLAAMCLAILSVAVECDDLVEFGGILAALVVELARR
jgi:AICAR transformylase/IMP cyclohydrolase PurH